METLEWLDLPPQAVVVAVVVDLVPTVAQADRLDLPAHQEPLVDQEIQDLLEAPASPDAHLPPCVLLKPQHHASHAQVVPPAHQDLQDQMEAQDSPDLQDKEVAHLPLASQDQQGPQDPMETQDSPEPQDSPELQLKASNPDPASQDHQEMLEAQEVQDSQEEMDNPEVQALQDPKDHLEAQASLETTANPVNLVPPVSLVGLERRVCAPSTAPSMEESSSRTELADDRNLGLQDIDWILDWINDGKNLHSSLPNRFQHHIVQALAFYSPLAFLFVATAMNHPYLLSPFF